jgi:hypothetical protein
VSNQIDSDDDRCKSSLKVDISKEIILNRISTCANRG